MDPDPREREVRRLLERYLVEIVETYDLCPWARAARTGGELAVRVLWQQPSEDAWVAAAEQALAQPGARVAMVIAPEWQGELRTMRDRVALRIPSAGVADFHPDAELDLATPAKLVPFLRRSPDPMLQLVPLALLDTARSTPPPAALADQARMLVDRAAPPREDAAERIARDNHARVTADHDAIVSRLADIAADRARSYARAGINLSPIP